MDQRSLPPHVLIFPFPVQGHVNCMLKLADLLCLAGLHVTFLNSEHAHSRLLRYTDVQSRFSRYPGFRFETISDGLPADHPRSGDRVREMFASIQAITKPLFREMVISGHRSSDTTRSSPPVTCIISDGIMCFTIDVAEELRIPIISFRPVSASCFWAFFCIPKLIEVGDLPIKGEDDMDRLLSSVPGMESFLRLRDLPSFCRVNDLTDPGLQLVTTETQQTIRANGLILNTFEDLEEPALSLIRNHLPKLYTIGPLHANLKARVPSETASLPQSSNSLWEEDRTCMTWLDEQPLKSVVYVSFGSMTVVTRDELIEFWYGLVNSGKRFLWVIRPNSVAGESQIPVELMEGTKQRGYMVGWAPQEEVLAHPAIGGFLTHSGWNSTLESIVAGVPMICWPYYADQQVNSRLVGEVWKLGMDMKDTCDRVTVEKMVNDLMELRRDEFVRSANQMAKLASRSVSEGGSSYCNLDCLIEDIKLMSRRVNLN
uniref:Glycosyltransferase n=1 Tax=Davidia involucrata TaxID=16924 RepID=A0A5B7A2C4_DAVIN